MGRKRELADPKKVTLLLHREDYEAMKGFYPIATAAVAIRALVHQHVEALRARAAAKANEAPLVLELDLEEKDV